MYVSRPSPACRRQRLNLVTIPPVSLIPYRLGALGSLNFRTTLTSTVNES